MYRALIPIDPTTWFSGRSVTSLGLVICSLVFYGCVALGGNYVLAGHSWADGRVRREPGGGCGRANLPGRSEGHRGLETFVLGTQVPERKRTQAQANTRPTVQPGRSPRVYSGFWWPAPPSRPDQDDSAGLEAGPLEGNLRLAPEHLHTHDVFRGNPMFGGGSDHVPVHVDGRGALPPSLGDVYGGSGEAPIGVYKWGMS